MSSWIDIWIVSDKGRITIILSLVHGERQRVKDTSAANSGRSEKRRKIFIMSCGYIGKKKKVARHPISYQMRWTAHNSRWASWAKNYSYFGDCLFPASNSCYQGWNHVLAEPSYSPPHFSYFSSYPLLFLRFSLYFLGLAHPDRSLNLISQSTKLFEKLKKKRKKNTLYLSQWCISSLFMIHFWDLTRWFHDCGRGILSNTKNINADIWKWINQL